MLILLDSVSTSPAEPVHGLAERQSIGSLIAYDLHIPFDAGETNVDGFEKQLHLVRVLALVKVL